MAKKKLSHDQKRKAKLKKRAERSNQQESMAYHGTKYRGPEYVPIIHRTESGILEAYVISGRTMSDADVEKGIGRLIELLRARKLPNLSGASSDEPVALPEESFLVINIVGRWRDFAETNPLPARDDLIGVLRTLLSSLETRRSMAIHPQGYLRFLEEFLGKTGTRVQMLTPEELEELEFIDEDDDYDDDDDDEEDR